MKKFPVVFDIIQFKLKYIFFQNAIGNISILDITLIYSIILTLMFVDVMQYFEREAVDIWKSKHESK